MSGSYCPACGNHNDEHNLFCRSCGDPLTDSARASGPISEAESLVSRGRLTDAIATVQRAIGESESSGLQVALATLYMRRGGTADARRALERALTLDPQNAVAHAYVGGMLLDAGQVHDAQERLDIARDLDPDDLVVRMKRAEYWLRLGIFANARAELTHGLRDGGGAPHIRAMAQTMLAAVEKRGRNSFSRQMVALPTFGWITRVIRRSGHRTATPVEVEVSQ